MHESWKSLLAAETKKTYFLVLKNFVQEERKQFTVYPRPMDTLNAFNVPYDDANVLILGQDPYHGAGQAHGLSFSVKPGVPTPPSLRNIFLELIDDVHIKKPAHGHLGCWAEQGVMLLNTTLTVRAREPGSHRGYGWERLTDTVIRCLNDREKPVVFILWGKPAAEKRDLIDNQRHRILSSPHPSPQSAFTGFFGSRPFSKANAALEANGLRPINWQPPT